jgi:hypothetical protein
MGGTVVLRPVHGYPDPNHVVELAIKERGADLQAAKAAGDPAETYDGVWAVMDVDTHPHLSQAVAEAKRSGVAVAISGPCFETWLILHLENRTAAFSTSKAAKDHWVKLAGSTRTAQQEFAQLGGKVAAASERAKVLTARHDQDAVPRHKRNPSSEIGVLIETVCARAGLDPKAL